MTFGIDWVAGVVKNAGGESGTRPEWMEDGRYKSICGQRLRSHTRSNNSWHHGSGAVLAQDRLLGM